MTQWIKDLLRNWVLGEKTPVQYVEMERILIGKTSSEKLEFWLSLDSWLKRDEGRAFMALQQREYERLHTALLTNTDMVKQPELVAQMRQQNFVISTPSEIEKRATRYRERVTKEEKRSGDYPQAA